MAICYRDRTYCESDCTNFTCSRYISTAVTVGARDFGLPLALCDFSKDCLAYAPPTTFTTSAGDGAGKSTGP